jgi:2-polyprenyl-3-methyl-5-hydroxy-6-metoxy-1,4-benzoquinol methylase
MTTIQQPITYRSVNRPVLESIPKSASRILEVGCGGGDLGKAIKVFQNCTITGITLNPGEAEVARTSLDHVLIADLNCINHKDLGQYDCIVCSHVLEHLYEPREFLRALVANCLAPNGTIIIALPNIVHWKPRLNFLLGRFRYTEGGVMDRTHFRFFDWNTATELILDSGLRLETKFADGVVPFSRILGPYSTKIDQTACSILPGLFGWQFVLIARSAPKP